MPHRTKIRETPLLLPEEPGNLFRPVLVTHSIPNIKPLHSVWAWQERGSCREAVNETFFIDENEHGKEKANKIKAAKRVCGGCPVIEECRAHAIALPEYYGTWGGLTEEERRSARRKEKRSKQRTNLELVS